MAETDETERRRPARSRFERARRGERPGLILTERDAALVTDLFTHGLMDRGQIQELYFGSVPRCNARLRQLFDHGYVSRAFPENAPYGARAVYRAGRAAAGVIAARLDLDAGAVRQACRTGADAPQYVEHTLAVVDFRLALQRAIRAAGRGAGTRDEIALDLWLPEMLCRHDYEIQGGSEGSANRVRQASRRWRAQVFKPDGFVRLARGGRLFSYFLEVDRGHTSSAKFAEKLVSHTRYQESGLFRELYGEESGAFHTLVVTTGERRLGHLKEIVEGAGSGLFWLTTFAAVETRGALAPIWRAPGRADPVALV